MTLEEIHARLYHHANLPSASPPENSLCFLLLKSRKSGRHADLSAAVRDVLACLAELNTVWNGPVPSETPRDKAVSHLDRRIAYSVSTIINDAIAYTLHCAAGSNSRAAEGQTAEQLAFVLSCAWDGVLAGDIDNLRESVRLELEAKAPGASHELF